MYTKNPQFGKWPNVEDDKIVKREGLTDIVDNSPVDTSKIHITKCPLCKDNQLDQDSTGFYCKKCDVLGVIVGKKEDNSIIYELKKSVENEYGRVVYKPIKEIEENKDSED